MKPSGVKITPDPAPASWPFWRASILTTAGLTAAATSTTMLE